MSSAAVFTACDTSAEPHEVFERSWVPLAAAAAQAADGRLQDAKTIAGLVWASTRVQAGKRQAPSEPAKL